MHIFSLWRQSEQQEHANLTHSHLSQKPACCEGTFLTTALLCLLQILYVSGHPLTSVSFVTVHRVVVYTFAWQAIDLIKWRALTHCGNPLWIREYPKVGFEGPTWPRQVPFSSGSWVNVVGTQTFPFHSDKVCVELCHHWGSVRLLVFKLESDVSSLLLFLILFLLEAVCTGYAIVFLYLIIIFLVTL